MRFHTCVLVGLLLDNNSIEIYPLEEFLEHSKREDDGATGTGPNIRAVLRSADVLLTNNGTIEELYAQVDAALEKFTK